MNTNQPYQLASQWLSHVSMDVAALNRECRCHVAVSAFWNRLAKLGDRPKGRFVPIYVVWWASPQNESAGGGSVAHVELYAPTKQLLQLTVYDERYILRKPLVISDLDSLFPGVGAVHTNRPSGKRPAHTRPG